MYVDYVESMWSLFGAYVDSKWNVGHYSEGALYSKGDVLGNIAPLLKDMSYMSITFPRSSIAVASCRVHSTIHVLSMLVESSINVSSVLTKFFLAASHLRMSVVAIESMNTKCEHHQE